MKFKLTSLRLSLELMRAIDRACAQGGFRSRSAFIEKILREILLVAK